MDRSRETLVKLEEFVKKVRGLEYSLDVEKLIRKTCLNDIENLDKSKTYFCSELVASCYKVLKIFPKGKAKASNDRNNEINCKKY